MSTARVRVMTPIDFILDAVVENAKLGDDETPCSYTVRELAKRGMIVFRPPFPER